MMHLSRAKSLWNFFAEFAAVAAGACRHAGIVGADLDILGGFDLTRALFAADKVDCGLKLEKCR